MKHKKTFRCTCCDTTFAVALNPKWLSRYPLAQRKAILECDFFSNLCAKCEAEGAKCRVCGEEMQIQSGCSGLETIAFCNGCIEKRENISL